STMGSVDLPPRFPSPLDVAGMDRYFFVHVFVATLPYTRRYHREHRVPEDIQHATLADLGPNIRVHRKRYGRGGLEVAQWIMLHFRGCIYQLGRLQFERTTMDSTIAEAVAAEGDAVSAETPALSV